MAKVGSTNSIVNNDSYLEYSGKLSNLVGKTIRIEYTGAPTIYRNIFNDC